MKRAEINSTISSGNKLGLWDWSYAADAPPAGVSYQAKLTVGARMYCYCQNILLALYETNSDSWNFMDTEDGVLESGKIYNVSLPALVTYFSLSLEGSEDYEVVFNLTSASSLGQVSHSKQCQIILNYFETFDPIPLY